ncbi:hypothetical protein GF352_03905 [archaeon]|nr:hypothetical protein [archaeon]
MTQNESISECRHPRKVKNNGYWVCPLCAEVLDRVITFHPKRAFSEEEVKSRRQTEPVLKKWAHRTLSDDSRDYLNKKIPNNTKRMFNRCNKWQIQAWTNESLNRNLITSESLFRTLKSNFSTPDYVWKEAKKIYFKCAEKQLSRGRSIKDLVIASLYTSMRVHEQPGSLKDLLTDSGFNIKKNRIAKCFKLLVQEGILSELGLILKPAAPPINKYCSDLGLSLEESNKIIKFYNKIPFKLKNGRDLNGVAGAAIYIFSSKSQREVAEVVGVSEATVRTRYKELENIAFKKERLYK